MVITSRANCPPSGKICVVVSELSTLWLLCFAPFNMCINPFNCCSRNHSFSDFSGPASQEYEADTFLVNPLPNIFQNMLASCLSPRGPCFMPCKVYQWTNVTDDHFPVYVCFKWGLFKLGVKRLFKCSITFSLIILI